MTDEGPVRGGSREGEAPSISSPHWSMVFASSRYVPSRCAGRRHSAGFRRRVRGFVTFAWFCLILIGPSVRALIPPAPTLPKHPDPNGPSVIAAPLSADTPDK